MVAKNRVDTAKEFATNQTSARDSPVTDLYWLWIPRVFVIDHALTTVEVGVDRMLQHGKSICVSAPIDALQLPEKWSSQDFELAVEMEGT